MVLPIKLNLFFRLRRFTPGLPGSGSSGPFRNVTRRPKEAATRPPGGWPATGDGFSEGDTTNGIFDDLFHDYEIYQECDDDLFDDLFDWFDDVTFKGSTNSTRPTRHFFRTPQQFPAHVRWPGSAPLMCHWYPDLLSATWKPLKSNEFALPSRLHNPSIPIILIHHLLRWVCLKIGYIPNEIAI